MLPARDCDCVKMAGCSWIGWRWRMRGVHAPIDDLEADLEAERRETRTGVIVEVAL